MIGRAKTIVKVAVFGGFILFSIFMGTSWKLDPPAPTRVGNNPYTVSALQLANYGHQLEGEPIVITSLAQDVRINASSGDMQFTIGDDLFDVSEQVLFLGWAPGGVQPAGMTIENGTLVVIKGICKILSEGFIEGTEIHVVLPDNVYLVSISGLVAIGVMLFAFFKLDIKRLRFTAKRAGYSNKKPGLEGI